MEKNIYKVNEDFERKIKKFLKKKNQCPILLLFALKLSPSTNSVKQFNILQMKNCGTD